MFTPELIAASRVLGIQLMAEICSESPSWIWNDS